MGRSRERRERKRRRSSGEVTSEASDDSSSSGDEQLHKPKMKSRVTVVSKVEKRSPSPRQDEKRDEDNERRPRGSGNRHRSRSPLKRDSPSTRQDEKLDEDKERRPRRSDNRPRSPLQRDSRRRSPRQEERNEERRWSRRMPRRSPEQGGRNEERRPRRRRSSSPGNPHRKIRDEEKEPKKEEAEPKKEERKAPLDPVLTRTGGAYIPPAKLRMMQKDFADKSSVSYQRIAWEALKKSINGLINKVNTSNVAIIVRELFKENLVRGRGVLCRSIMQAQSASPTFTNVYAALVAIINTKFPNIGELILKRLVIQFRRGYTRNDKPACLAAASFIGHLVNQEVAHEVLALEILTLLLEHPTEDSVQVAISFLKDVGARIDEVSPKGAHFIFERLRNVLNEAKLDKRIQYMIEVMFQVRKDKYKDFVSVPDDLDLVEEEEQFTHLITLDEATDGQDILNVFKADTEYIANEEKYTSLRKEILDESENDEEGEDEEGEDEEEEEGGEVPDSGTILDKTETNLLGLRKTIYLTIQSSLDFEECAHKLLKMNMQDGQESELCHMILDCCAQKRTYEKFFGLLAGRFCAINMKYGTAFEVIFKDTYDTVHRLDTNKLRNVAKFFAHLLITDSCSWGVLKEIRMTEEDTSSSSRVFLKIMFQELSEYMGLNKLNERITDSTLSFCFEGLFPRDHPKNTRFAINFFTSIGLGGLTEDLREHLKKHPKPTAIVVPQVAAVESQEADHAEAGSKDSSSSSEESSSSSDSSSSSSDSSSDSSSSSSSESEAAPPARPPPKDWAKHRDQLYRDQMRTSTKDIAPVERKREIHDTKKPRSKYPEHETAPVERKRESHDKKEKPRSKHTERETSRKDRRARKHSH